MAPGEMLFYRLTWETYGIFIPGPMVWNYSHFTGTRGVSAAGVGAFIPAVCGRGQAGKLFEPL